ncbi:MAG: flagellar hook-associated protein FlgL [Planctomycetota bacterium]
MAGMLRVTNAVLHNSTLSSLQDNLRAIAEDNRKISTGKQFAVASDNPLSVRRLIAWETVIERNEKYQSNIEFASSRLGATESALDQMNDMIIRAREIALQQINGTATDQTRANSAVEIDSLINESLTLVNRQFGDRYLFGGTRVDEAPFERAGNFVAYLGNDNEPAIEIAPTMMFESSISGVRAFGGFSSQISSASDLDPVAVMTTSLNMLNNGRGVEPGMVEIRDGLGERMLIDLSAAKTLDDVVNMLNNSGFIDSAALLPDGKGLQLQKAGANLTVLDVNGGSTASDLGLVGDGMGPVALGGDVDPMIMPITPLNELVGGSGVDTSGFTITNGTLSATIDFTSVTTVEDLLNAVNTSGTNTVARLNADGRSIEIMSTLAGADLFIEENGGTTAADLGFLLTADDTPVERFHGGGGLLSVPGADFRITAADATEFDVDVSSAQTLGDVVALINDNPANGGAVVAQALSGPLRIELTDASGVPGDLSVAHLNGSFSASTLGIDTTTSSGSIVGADLAPGGVRLESVFDGFALLYEGLSTSDDLTIEEAMRALDRAETGVLQARATVGGRVRRLEISERRTEIETFEFRELMSQEGDTDIAEAVLEFQRHEFVYQASLQTSAGLLQSTILDFLN